MGLTKKNEPSGLWGCKGQAAHLLNDSSENDRPAVKDAGPEHDAPIPLRYAVGANQLRSEVMPDEILTLGHHEFIQRVQEIEISPLDRTGLLFTPAFYTFVRKLGERRPA